MKRATGEDLDATGILGGTRPFKYGLCGEHKHENHGGYGTCRVLGPGLWRMWPPRHRDTVDKLSVYSCSGTTGNSAYIHTQN